MARDWLFWRKGEWSLEGYDTFAGEAYFIADGYRTKEKAVRAAKKQLKKIERAQPSEISGGQEGIQDQVFVSGPDGTFRILPDD